MQLFIYSYTEAKTALALANHYMSKYKVDFSGPMDMVHISRPEVPFPEQYKGCASLLVVAASNPADFLTELLPKLDRPEIVGPDAKPRALEDIIERSRHPQHLYTIRAK